MISIIVRKFILNSDNSSRATCCPTIFSENLLLLLSFVVFSKSHDVVSACRRSLETNSIQFIEYSFCCRELKCFYNFIWSHDNGITNTFQTCLRYTWAIFNRSLVIVAHWDGKLRELDIFLYCWYGKIDLSFCFSLPYWKLFKSEIPILS